MAARAIIAAVQQRFNGFSFTGKPAVLYFGKPPTKNPDGSAVSLPIAELFDEGGPNKSTGGLWNLIHQNLRIEVYSDDTTSLKNIELGLKFNGGAVDAGAGFHHATTLPFDSTVQFMAMYLLEEPTTEFQDDRSYQALRVYKLTMRFCVECLYVG